MAEEGDSEDTGGSAGAADGGDAMDAPVKCPECTPGLPGWMATFSDLVTLLLTFFVLLLSFAKTETAKYEAALGSIRNAFGGNVLNKGEVIVPGKSPEDQPIMMDATEPIKPFPIEFLTMEGMLDKHEINRESTETLNEMKESLKAMRLDENVDIYEMPEGIKIRVKDKIFFKEGMIEITQGGHSKKVLDRMLKLLIEKDWTVFVEGHASRGERDEKNKGDAFQLSANRSGAVSRYLIQNGVKPQKITTVFYGDTRPNIVYKNNPDAPMRFDRRVEFILRKTDLHSEGHKVPSQ